MSCQLPRVGLEALIALLIPGSLLPMRSRQNLYLGEPGGHRQCQERLRLRLLISSLVWSSPVERTSARIAVM